MWFAKFFSHSVSNILILLMISLAIQKHFRLVVPFVYFCFFFVFAVSVIYKKIINKINVKEHIAYILFYDFRSYIQVFNSFELIFLCSVSSGPALFYFIWLSVFSILLAWNNFFFNPFTLSLCMS